jgi:transposase
MEKNNKLNPGTKEEFYARLKEELNKNHEWPTKYMYKFIVPNDEQKIEEVKKRFDKKYQFRQSFSRNAKYASLTFITEEENPESIINRYKRMEDIEGLIAI